MLTPESLHTTQCVSSREEEIKGIISDLVFIDIGYVTNVISKNKVDVAIYRFREGRQISYSNIEVLSVGGVRPSLTGATGLILIPKTVVTDLYTGKLSPSSPYYSSQGAKFLPLFSEPNSLVEIAKDTGGDISLGSYGVNILLGEESITLVQRDEDSNIISDIVYFQDGNYLRTLYDTNNNIIYKEEYTGDGTRTLIYYNTNDKEITTIQQNANGSYSRTLYDGQGTEDDNIKFSLGVADDGTVDIKANKTTIQIDNTGKVTISAEEKVELTAKKGMLLTSKDDFKLDASGKNITFTCSEFNVNNGNLKVT